VKHFKVQQWTEPGRLFVGIDPGPRAGAAAVIESEPGGGFDLRFAMTWKARRSGGHRIRAFIMHAEGEVVDHTLTDSPFEVFRRLAGGLDPLWGDRSVQPFTTAAVEGLFAIRTNGLIPLAEDAGGWVAVLGLLTHGDILRPGYSKWVPAVSRMTTSAGKATIDEGLADCLHGRPSKVRSSIIEWDLFWDSWKGTWTADEHLVDAIGLALFASPGKLVEVCR